VHSKCYHGRMKSIHLWHGSVGIALVCVGIGIIGGVAYLLYAPEPASPQEVVENTVSYMCGETRVLVAFSDSDATVTLPDSRSIAVVYTPPTPEAPPEALLWQRYASTDGSFIFWRSSEVAFFEEDGNVLFGQCEPENQG